MAEPGADLAAICAAFGDQLRRSGIPVTPDRSARFAEAAALAEPDTLGSLYWLGRITLLSAHAHISVYDRVFRRYFRSVDEPLGGDDVNANPLPSTTPGDPASPDAKEREATAPPGPPAGPPAATDEEGDPADEETVPVAASNTAEQLADHDFAKCTPDELALINALVDRFPLVPPRRRGRRTFVDRGGPQMDMRATLRRAHRTGGDPVLAVRRSRRDRPRRIVLIADVSASMEAYSRVYLHLMRGAVRAVGAEAFVFATRLTRLTRVLAHGQVDQAYAVAARAARDWSGGTRIGHALTTFIDEHGRRGVARGAIVVIVSDGWETEDPELVGEAMRKLSLLAHSIVWVNPRSSVTGYQPLVGGMAAAMPYVDTMVSGHSLRALDDVLAAIRSVDDLSRLAPLAG